MAYRYRHGKVGGFASAAKKLIASRPVKRRGRPRVWVDVPTPRLANAVKRVINRQEETKFVSLDPVDVDMGSSSLVYDSAYLKHCKGYCW